MKYKYRLILRGDNKYIIEYKEKGIFSVFFKWKETYGLHDKESEAIIYMHDLIRYENNRYNKKFKKVIKEIDND